MQRDGGSRRGMRVGCSSNRSLRPPELSTLSALGGLGSPTSSFNRPPVHFIHHTMPIGRRLPIPLVRYMWVVARLWVFRREEALEQKIEPVRDTRSTPPGYRMAVLAPTRVTTCSRAHHGTEAWDIPLMVTSVGYVSCFWNQIKCPEYTTNNGHTTGARKHPPLPPPSFPDLLSLYLSGPVRPIDIETRSRRRAHA